MLLTEVARYVRRKRRLAQGHGTSFANPAPPMPPAPPAPPAPPTGGLLGGSARADARSRLRLFLRSDEGREFLDECAASCEAQLAFNPSHTRSAGLLGSCLEKQGRLDEALHWLRVAVSLGDPGQPTPWGADLARVRRRLATRRAAAAWVHGSSPRQTRPASSSKVANADAGVVDSMAASEASETSGASEAAASPRGSSGGRRRNKQRAASGRSSSCRSVLPVPRRAGLTLDEFEREYAAKSRPVILTDVRGVARGTAPWSFDTIRRCVGDRRVKLKRAVVGSASWAKLEEDDKTTTVAELIDALFPAAAAAGSDSSGGTSSVISDGYDGSGSSSGSGSGSSSGSSSSSSSSNSSSSSSHNDRGAVGGSSATGVGSPVARGCESAGQSGLPSAQATLQLPYLHDWSLPQHAPSSLLEQLEIPMCFSGDLLQRVAPTIDGDGKGGAGVAGLAEASGGSSGGGEADG